MSSALRPMARAFSASVVSTTLCSGARNADGPISSSSLGGVLGRGQVRMGARAALRGELQHPWPERRHDAALFRDAVLVELVQVVVQGVDGLAVFGERFGMPDADAQQKSSGVGLVDAVE